MSKLSLPFILVLLCLSYSSFACHCPTRKWSVESVNSAIENSDVVFIGERIKYLRDENFEEKYSFKVVEAIKGNIKAGETVNGSTHNSCSGSPNEEGLWIIYATLEDEGLIDFAYTGCGSSRSLHSLNVPPPLSDNDEHYKERLAMIHLE